MDSEFFDDENIKILINILSFVGLAVILYLIIKNFTKKEIYTINLDEDEKENLINKKRIVKIPSSFNYDDLFKDDESNA
jgi:hypothetical protein